MKKTVVLLTLSILVGLTYVPALGTYSVGFSTGLANEFSWTVNVLSAQDVRITFDNNEIDTSEPTPDPVLNDAIDLPDMTLTNIATVNIAPGVSLITAELAPLDDGTLTIISDVASGPAAAGQVVMESTIISSGGFVTVGTNYIAYSQDQDDLDVNHYVPGYSTVIDKFATFDAQGFALDLSFGGDSSASLFNLLNNLDPGSVSGTLSGQIVIVPEPVTMVLLGLGGLLLRRRR